MDREIPKQQLKRERLIRWAKIGGVAITIASIIALGRGGKTKRYILSDCLNSL